jgi:ABC-type transport system involved in cytochrome bd biosynthesis fused ATPase/permease subunit
MGDPPPRHRHDTPAWPLGCAAAVLGLLLSFNIAGLIGYIVSRTALPPWLMPAGPLLGWLLVPLLMLAGWAVARRRNPYGARVLLWGFALSLLLLAALTALFDLLNRLA